MRHRLDHRHRIVGQALAGCRRLFKAGGVLLGRLVKIVDRSVDFGKARALLACRTRDLADKAVDAGNRLNDLAQRVAGLADKVHAVLHVGAAFGDQLVDLSRRFRAALRQSPDL